MDELESILAELRPRIREWYPDADATAGLDVLDVDTRAVAQVIRVRVARTAAPPAALIVKASGVGAAADASDRPRLVPISEPSERLQLEFDALRTIEARVDEVGDPGFAAVRPLGILPESKALVMEAFDAEPLHQFLVRLPFRARVMSPQAAVRSAGRWLRILHDTPASAQAVRQGTRKDVVEAFAALGSYLAAEKVSPHLDSVVEAGIAAAQQLPDPLPTVITHGDFAPRNILIDRSGRMAVIDLLLRWRASPFDDLAGFLVALHTSRANAATRGLLFGRTIESLEPAFLTGYYGSEPVPRHQIRVYELLLVLDKWAARASRNRALSGVRRIRERLIDRHFDARSRLLAQHLRGL